MEPQTATVDLSPSPNFRRLVEALEDFGLELVTIRWKTDKRCKNKEKILVTFRNLKGEVSFNGTFTPIYDRWCPEDNDLVERRLLFPMPDDPASFMEVTTCRQFEEGESKGPMRSVSLPLLPDWGKSKWLPIKEDPNV